MAKKKVVKKAVSRRSTKTASESPKAKKTTKKKKPAVVSKEVSQTLELIHSFSASEMKYYTQVRDLVNEEQADTIQRQHQIGTLLLKCQREHPKSNAASNIVLAVGITPSTGRYLRKFAERVKPDELKSYLTLKNEKLDWKIPLDTIYKIVEKWDSKEDRMRIAKAVANEKMSSNTMLERFPVNDRNEEEADRVVSISIKAGIRKLQHMLDQENKQYDLVIDAFKAFEDADQLLELAVLASETLDMTTAVEQKREAIKELFEALSNFTEDENADEVLALIGHLGE